MRSYRCFYLTADDTIAAADYIESETDAEALEQAESVFHANEAGLSSYELWDGARIVRHELESSVAQIRRRLYSATSKTRM